jgi:AraC-like DNA-binding protein
MNYVRYIPSSPLNEYVNNFYYLDGPMPYPHARIVPLPSFDLKLNFGGAVRMVVPAHPERTAFFGESWCVGVWSESHAVDWPSDMQIIGVNLKPVGASILFDLPLYELHNQVVTLDTLWGNFATEIRERLYAAPTTQVRLAVLEKLLLARLYNVPSNFNIVQYAVLQIARYQGALSIRSLSDEVGISQTHLARLFKQMVGVLPKELARLHRFESVLRSIDISQPVDWTQLAYQCGFYDQAHFSKDFAAFTGASPSDYLRLRRQLCAENPEHLPLYRNLPTV